MLRPTANLAAQPGLNWQAGLAPVGTLPEVHA
jgi:hypothetical protein